MRRDRVVSVFNYKILINHLYIFVTCPLSLSLFLSLSLSLSLSLALSLLFRHLFLYLLWPLIPFEVFLSFVIYFFPTSQTMFLVPTSL